MADPGCNTSDQFPNGYQIPEDITSWPAQGDTADGFSATLAPFFDRNTDGLYSPNEGDHPIFCGDFATYYISNDVAGANQITDFPSLGVELHTSVYGYDSAVPSLFNTLFVQIKIFNRSPNTYTDVYIGRQSDFDLGNPQDDYVGTDVERAMVIGYNGDMNDESHTSGPGYGTDLGIIALKTLKGALADPDGIDNIGQNNYGPWSTGWDDGIVDNERIGLSSSMSNTNVGAGISVYPFLPFEFHNYLNSTWPDGTGQIFGGSGYNAAGLGIPARYVFPGLSDPIHYGTDGVDPNYPDPAGWTEESEGHAPFDRRIVASSGPFTFAPGDVQTIDYAYIFARESHDPDQDVLTTLRQYADEIVGLECGELPQITTGLNYGKAPKLDFQIFPNPSNGVFWVEIPESSGSIKIEIYDTASRKVFSQENRNGQKQTIKADLAGGVYFIRVQADDRVGTKKLVVE